MAFARSCGASEVFVVAWSVGASIALELVRHRPTAIDRQVLVAPATNWRRIVQHGVKRAGLPTVLAHIMIAMMESPIASRLIGIPNPLEFSRLEWSRNYSLDVPTLVLHSSGDEEIPFKLTQEFVRANESVSLVEAARAHHGWEADTDPGLFRAALRSH